MKTNKQIKRMIASMTGGMWIDEWLINKPELLIFNPSPFNPDELILHERYHKTVSIKASEVK